MTGLEVYQPLEPGPLGVGSRIRQELVVSGQHLKFELQVTQLEPPSAAELRFEGSGFKAVNEYTVTPRRRRRLRGDLGDLGRHDLVQGQAARADGAGQARGEARHRSRPPAIAAGVGREGDGKADVMRLLLALLLLLVLAPAARAGELIDRAASELRHGQRLRRPGRRPVDLRRAGRGAARADRVRGRGPDVRRDHAARHRATRPAARRAQAMAADRRAASATRRARTSSSRAEQHPRRLRLARRGRDQRDHRRRDRGRRRRPQHDPDSTSPTRSARRRPTAARCPATASRAA